MYVQGAVLANLKYCTICKNKKETSEFYIRKNGMLRAACKPCSYSYKKEPKGRFKEYRRKAKLRKYSFEITLEQFKKFEGENCFYCGDELDIIRLDRINNDLGYIMDNVVSCCKKCNFAKNTLEVEEFLDHISKIYIHQQKRNEK